jgi:hypothetical protein
MQDSQNFKKIIMRKKKIPSGIQDKDDEKKMSWEVLI